jgi:hypothetical protein
MATQNTNPSGPSFFEKNLRPYFLGVADTLRIGSASGKLFTNNGDRGTSREYVYADFLRNHLPSACNIILGGNLFNQRGEVSKQIDIIVTTDVCPRFNHANPDGTRKSSACVDGTLGVVTVKSMLDKQELFDSLSNLASIPQHQLNGVDDLGPDAYFDHWPFKAIFAFDGASAESVMDAMTAFSVTFGNYPRNRQPDMIHVLGKYRLCKFPNDMKHEGHVIKAGRYVRFDVDCDVAAMSVLIVRLQQALLASRHVTFEYGDLFQNLFDMRSNA